MHKFSTFIADLWDKIPGLRLPRPGRRLGLFILFVALVGGFLILYYFILRDLPSPTRLVKNNRAQSTQIYDRHGTLLYTIYNSHNQTFTPLSKIPLSMQEATIAIEDKDFYHHGAVDFRGMARALYSIIFKKQLQGGSTLTQQLVKTSLLTPDRTIQRKVREVILSFVTEMMYSKKDILEMYLNQVPYGGTAYGVSSAARTYFGKSANQLDLAESAYLAGLPESPSTFSPYGSRPELGKDRQVEILKKMHTQGYISEKQEQEASQEPLHFAKITNPIKAPHFVFYVKDLLVKKYGLEKVEQGGLKVYTTLDLPIQNFAQQTVASQVAQLTSYRVGNGAVVVTQPGTGEILAMVGSKNYFDPEHGNVNATLSQLQPGSSIKPINYATGLSKGYTAATPFIDEAICFPDPGHAPYCPHNYDHKFHGPVQMRQALGNSFNIPAVEMLKLNGVDAMIATASAMGIDTFTDPRRYGLSLTLGGGDVTMLGMATAYGVFANQGYRVDLHPILKVTDNTGRVLEQYVPPSSPIFGTKVLDPGIAFIMTDMLSDNNARLQEFGPNSALRINDKKIAVKTGTTNDIRDNWTIGYTPQYVVTVWVGNFDHSPMAGIASGITGAAPIWHIIMDHLVTDEQIIAWPSQPADVIRRAICSPSGLLPSAAGCNARNEYFIKGTVPKKVDPGTQKVWVDKTTQDLPKPGQTDNLELKDEVMITDPLNNRYCLTCQHPTPLPTPTP